MTRVFKIDILTGHEDKSILHFILKFIFHCIFVENHAVSQNLYNLFWKYGISSNEILLKDLFLKPWNK